MYERRDLLGILFFSLGILSLVSMFISPLMNIYLHVDEYWTYTLINLPIRNAITVIVNDVHPPLYYGIVYLLTPFGLNNLYLLKVVSIIPYILLMVVSATKIRKDYGLLTAGLFVMCLGLMSDFFVEFLTIRMYSWGLFFVVMAFIYYNEVLTHWNRKSWVLLTLFTLLSAYTQYFFGITCALMYLLILYNILTENKDKLKQFGKSLLALIILYAPWMIVFVRQIMTESSGFHEGFKLDSIIHYLFAFAIKSEDFRPEMIAFKLIALVFLVFLLVLIYKQKNRFAGAGVFLMYATIAVGIVTLMFSFENTMRMRYLVPVCGIFWLSASVVIGKVKDYKILVIALILVMVLACASLQITDEDANSRIKAYDKKMTFLDSINNNNSVVVFNTDYGYRVSHDDLNKVKQYSLGDTYFYDNDTEICKDLNKILDANKGKKIYLVNWKNTDRNKQYEDNYNLTKVYDEGHYTFNLVKK